MLTFGLSDDVNPFIAIGAALKARGHSVALATNPYFEDLVNGAGLQFIPIGTDEEIPTLLDHPDFWHPQRGINIVIQHGIRPLLRPTFEVVHDFAQGQKGVVLSSWHAFGARFAQEKFGVPVITIHKEPESVASVDATPVYAQGDFSQWPRWLRRWVYRLTAIPSDRWLDPEFNQLRQELGLAPVHRIFTEWMHSPLLTVGLWPEWFAPPQRDWPPQVRLTNFPLCDNNGVEVMPDLLEAFLNEGPPPVVFTLGEEMRQGKQFFEESVDACRRTDTRGILLTKFSEQVPDNLPSNIRVFGSVPFRGLLPRVAALVHHGGTGSIAQALAAGIPQIVMPTTFDQPDNAARVQRLGVGLTLPPKSYCAEKVAELLANLKSDPSYRLRAQEVRQRLQGNDGITLTCDVIEQTANLAVMSVRPS